REHATVPLDRGVFLPITWRMHEGVCRFISEGFYDGRLNPNPSNQNQYLVLDDHAHPGLMRAGIAFCDVQHAGCSPKSEEEAIEIEQLYSSLLTQEWRDKAGVQRQIGTNDVLVVSPYNMQVNLLRDVLPKGARVGTVDKFQGQEAAAVLISMATSSAE